LLVGVVSLTDVIRVIRQSMLSDVWICLLSNILC
jgi:hypothetical protein